MHWTLICSSNYPETGYYGEPHFNLDISLEIKLWIKIYYIGLKSSVKFCNIAVFFLSDKVIYFQTSSLIVLVCLNSQITIY